MSISPIITFKAGICDFVEGSSTPKVYSKATPGYIYLYEEDDLIQFCWRPRSASMSAPELQLNMVPPDGRFIPYQEKSSSNSDSDTKSPTNGRIFVLKFQSSSSRYLFWLQSKSQHPQGDPAWFSPRDLKLGAIVDRLLQGEEVNVQEEVADISNDRQGSGGDTEMEDVRPEGSGDIQGNIGSGDPFIGSPEDEGSGSRDGGADGGRAPPTDAAAAVQNFLQSLKGNQALQTQSSAKGKLFTTLPELLHSDTTIAFINDADQSLVDNLLSNLPPVLLLLNQEADELSSVDPTPETAQAALEALSLSQKKDILRKVFHSPQFSQSLGSLTQALRDGGLPTISEALGVHVAKSGYIKEGSGVPLGGGDAVEAFVNGFKIDVEKKSKGEESSKMETDR